jgi:serine/threonine protein kinase
VGDGVLQLAQSFGGTGRFRLVRELGAGGMGVVYEAFDRETLTPVALKTLRRAQPEALVQLKREFRAIQDLAHPNLVTLGELIEHEGNWFFTMELVDGVDFISWVRPTQHPASPTAYAPTLLGSDADASESVACEVRGRPHEQRLRAALPQLASAIDALHRAHLVHRDIKPSNVLVTRDGRVVLLDLGLVAGAYDTDDERLAGTIAYMAPEQAAAQAVGPEADWWAFGAMLFEALTGRLPHEGAALEVMAAKQANVPPNTRSLSPESPTDLDELCMALLRLQPAERLRGMEILRRLGVSSGSSPVSLPPSLCIGRRAELSWLEHAFKRSEAGRATCVVIHGESGIGKSWLARHFCEQLAERRSDVLVLAGRCYERERVAYKAFDGVMDALGRQLGRLPQAEARSLAGPDVALISRLFPSFRLLQPEATSLPDTRDASELRPRAFAAVRDLFKRVARWRPVVLRIDDLHWADADSRALATAMLGGRAPPPLMLVCTQRDQQPALDLASVETMLLHLERLGEPDSRELATRLLGGASSELAARVALESRGHPLFLKELAHHALIAGRSEAATLDAALMERITGLDARVRRLLELVCFAGAPLQQGVAMHAADLGRSEALGVFGQLRAAHLVRTTGARDSDTIEPYHDRIRETLEPHLVGEPRKALARALAVALELHCSDDAERLSNYWRAAGDRRRAAVHATCAAERAAASLAFDRAARWYREALVLGPPPWLSHRLRLGLGQALANAGRGAEAARALLSATKGASAAESLDLQRRAAEQLLRAGHIDEGVSTLAAVLERIDMPLTNTPQRALASLAWRRAKLRLRGLSFARRDASQLSAEQLTRVDTCWSVAGCFAFVDTVRGTDFQTRHLLLALRAGEPFRVARALATEAGYSAIRGRRARRRTELLLSRASRLADELDDPHALGFARGAAGIAAYLEGRWLDARDRCDDAVEIFRRRCTGASWELDSVELYALFARAYLGELRELGERTERALSDARNRGDLYALTNLHTAHSTLAQIAHGEPQAVKAGVDEALAKWSPSGYHLQHFWGLLAHTNADLYLGDPTKARRRWAQALPALERSLLLRVQVIRIEALHARARVALALGLRDEANQYARRLEREDAPHAAALAAAIRGDREQLRSALDGFRRAGMAAHQACVALQLGESDPWFAREEVRDPERFARMLVP